MGPCTASSCCCQAPNLPWAPVPTPHAAARPVICHGPCTASSCCCQVQSVSWVPVRPPIAAVSIATLCHVPLSGLLTLLVVSIFVIGCCMASHCCCLHRHTVAPHSGFGPVTAQMSEVCGDSKIDGTHLHVILTVSIISLPQQTPRAFKLKVQCSALI
ncbi:unnamed protein product [Staurois parvus]|uniref:Uncharacterized protein n=1 Tax=Staurois parvus TaxID=386267 RepID=A0ABN9CVR7_9NEOB|nr:unnamed protein product [Staurois parvus]CAI9577305.1 unnamed protein product [Staurois parvus]